MLVLSFDVGVRNLAFALVEYEGTVPMPAAALAGDAADEGAVVRAKRAVVASTRVLELATVDTTAHVRPGVCTKNVNKIPVLELGRAVLRGLDAQVRPVLARLDAAGRSLSHVIIENQPVLKNPSMKSVQMVIFTFFVRHYIDREGVGIRMFQARDKLGIYTGEEVPCSLKSPYSRRKRLSVEYTRRLLGRRIAATGADADAQTRAARAAFEVSKKRDDLADCYLQGLTFLYRMVVPAKVRRKKRARKRKRGETTSAGSTGEGARPDAA